MGRDKTEQPGEHTADPPLSRRLDSKPTSQRLLLMNLSCDSACSQKRS